MKLRHFFASLFIVLFFTGTAWAEDKWTIVHAGTLLAVPGEAPKTEQSLVIHNGIIVEIRDGYIGPGDLDVEGEVVMIHDLMDKFVLPGLIDMHVHITGELGPGSQTAGFFMEDSEVAIRASMFALRTLEAGFTTVRNAGADPAIMIGLKKSITKGYVLGPRIIYANSVRITGGHGDPSGYRADIMDFIQGENVCTGAVECAKATRNAIKLGGDWIKVAATGGVLTNTNTGTSQQMTDEELKAVVDAARVMGRKVAAHAHGADGIKAALRAGVATIEHGTMMDDEAIRLFKETGAYYVPTILAGHTVMEIAKNTNVLPPKIAEKALLVGPMIQEAVRRAHEGGVKIAFGTDSGVSKHGDNAKEFELMVAAGMSPVEAIIAATINAADALGLSDTIGTLEVGKAADLIAVEGNPLEDVSELMDVDFVMIGGKIAKH